VPHAAPSVGDTSWPINWIDHFVLARLERIEVAPSPAADRVTLIRRLAFDLTGLPPSPAEVDQFVADLRPDAYERLVERLFASPAYGERMAVWWLDLVRYADTVGYHGDQEHHISPYRDYVIDSFNDDLPFDRFTREQLAGDLVPGTGVDQKIASGYNRLLQTSHEGGVQAKEYLTIYAADKIRNLSAVWLGGTLGCAQCHDHKYDPYTSRDFYSMVAFFADVDEARHLGRGVDRSPTVREPELKVLTHRERTELAAIDSEIRALEGRIAQQEAIPESEAAECQQRIEQARGRKEKIEGAARLTMITVAIEPRVTRILPRGNWLDDSGPIVEPAIPEFLGRLETGGRRANRLDLADWLTDPGDGVGLLTARVFANRFWYLAFGRGISDALDDFGGQGEPPVYPELLDRLTHEFVASGWSVKHMLRLIVLSQTYRQSSLAPPELRQIDPKNELFARQGRFRLFSEAIRDNALAVSGLLVNQCGGSSVRPYQPAGYYRHLNFPSRSYQHDKDGRQWRRGVYVHWQRQFLHPMLKAFDAPSREECTARRPTSNTPLAALTLLNDPTFVEAARALAARILREGGDSTDNRLAYAFRLAVSRLPDDRERAVLQGLLESSRAHYRVEREAASQLVRIGESPPANEPDAAELAAWTAVARAILNLSETTTRN
jgi:hypothetical protein